MKPIVRTLLIGVGVVALFAVAVFGGSALIDGARHNSPEDPVQQAVQNLMGFPVKPPAHLRLPADGPSNLKFPPLFTLYSVQTCGRHVDETFTQELQRVVTAACADYPKSALVVKYETVSLSSSPSQDVSQQATRALRRDDWLEAPAPESVTDETLNIRAEKWSGELLISTVGSQTADGYTSSNVSVIAVLKPTEGASP